MMMAKIIKEYLKLTECNAQGQTTPCCGSHSH